MKKNILKIFSSIILSSIILLNLVACNNNTKTNNETKKPVTETKQEHSRPSRKPQVSIGKNESNLYSDGEIVSLADGSKIKYSNDGNHEIVQKGDGQIIIFKNVSDADLEKLEPNQRELVKRQMKADPNGFSLIY